MAEPTPKVCRYCGKLYRSTSSLNDHERRHNNVAPFRCCGNIFFSKTYLLRHKCNVHGSPKTETCEVCNAAFGTKTELNVHNMRVHKEKDYKCDTCGKTFATPGDLVDHVGVHTGEKRHVCKCGKAYRYGPGLSKHRKTCKDA